MPEPGIEPQSDSLVDLWEVIACEYCHAPAGQGCVTRTGRPARSHWCRIVEMADG